MALQKRGSRGKVKPKKKSETETTRQIILDEKESRGSELKLNQLNVEEVVSEDIGSLQKADPTLQDAFTKTMVEERFSN